MKKILVILIVVVIPNLVFGEHFMRIVTGSKTGTYIKIGHNLKRFVAGKADVRLEVATSKGSLENVDRLWSEPNTELAIVQWDVIRDLQTSGDAMKLKIFKKLRLVTPLYNEEIHILAGKDVEAEYVHEIGNLRISLGAVKSGTSLTSQIITDVLFPNGLKSHQVFRYGTQKAVEELLAGKIDVAFIVAGQPVGLLGSLQATAKDAIKFLKFDLEEENTKILNDFYPASIIKAQSYQWLDEDIDVLAVPAVLATFNYQNQSSTINALVQMADAIKSNIDVLRQNGHAKWNEIDLACVKSSVWQYYEPLKPVFCGSGVAKCKKGKKKLCELMGHTGDSLIKCCNQK